MKTVRTFTFLVGKNFNEANFLKKLNELKIVSNNKKITKEMIIDSIESLNILKTELYYKEINWTNKK